VVLIPADNINPPDLIFYNKTFVIASKEDVTAPAENQYLGAAELSTPDQLNKFIDCVNTNQPTGQCMNMKGIVGKEVGVILKDQHGR
jgi:hypothetical protein